MTRSHMIMTFILCPEGDQMLQVFSCQATVEHRAQRHSLKRGGTGTGGGYYITASGTNLAAFLGEKTLCVSECDQFLERGELWTRTSCVWSAAARRSGTQLLICTGVMCQRPKDELLVNMLTVA